MNNYTALFSINDDQGGGDHYAFEATWRLEGDRPNAPAPPQGCCGHHRRHEIAPTTAVGPAQSSRASTAVAARPNLAFPKIHPKFVITPNQALDWNVFKTQGGPTYAGSTGWKRFTEPNSLEAGSCKYELTGFRFPGPSPRLSRSI